MSFYIPTDEDRKKMHDRIDANLEYDNTMNEHSPMPWRYLEQTGFLVDANGEYIAQTWNKKEENFPNAATNGNAIAQLTEENAKLHEQLAEAKRLLRNVMLAEDKDLYPRIADVHEWLTVNEE